MRYIVRRADPRPRSAGAKREHIAALEIQSRLAVHLPRQEGGDTIVMCPPRVHQKISKDSCAPEQTTSVVRTASEYHSDATET